MNHKRTTISIVLATVMLVSLFAVVSSAGSVSGQTMTGTGPAMSTSTYSNAIIDYFAVDSSGTVWHTTGNGNWDSLGGVASSSPAAVSWPFASYLREDVFVRGSNGALYWNYYQSGWSGWHNLGGQLASGTGPAACHGTQVVSTFLWRVPTAPCGINGLQILVRRGLAGNPSAGS